MLKIRIAAFLFLFICHSFFTDAQNFGGNPSFIKWKQINSSAARVIFPPGLDSQAMRMHNLMVLLNDGTTNTIGARKRKWNIILQNQTTISNAYVRLAPVMSELYLTPDQDNFSNGSIRWDDNLLIHENRHMQQLSNFNNGFPKLFSFFLGQEGQLLANGITIPDYFFEGDAVWQETLVSRQGRGRLPSFYNGFKSLWLENKNYSWMKLRSGSLKDYVPDHYQLGYLMVAYGYEKYGKDFWKKVTGDAVRFKGLFFSFNKAIERYSGKSYSAFREEALSFFKAQSLEKASPDTPVFITPLQKNNVEDYLLPQYVSDDTVVVSKSSYRKLNGFYLLYHGKEKKIRIKNVVLNEYFSYNNGKIVYASFQSDPRWANRNYSVIHLLDIRSGHQKQLTRKSKYFSPDINKAGTEVIAVHADPDGANYLCRIDAHSGAVIAKLPNPENYFFTQTKYIDSVSVVSAVREKNGRMALVKVNLATGGTEILTPFSFNVVGYPFVKNDTIYFSAMNGRSDKVFAVNMYDKKIIRITTNIMGIYHPVLNSRNEMLASVFTSDGYRVTKISTTERIEISPQDFAFTPDLYTPQALKQDGAGILNNLVDKSMPVTSYKKSFRLFNFHSRRPFVNDPEYGYSFYSDNILSTFSNNLTYTYNRNEKSHSVGFNGVFAGFYPLLSLGTEISLNRTFDTAIGKSYKFNSGLVRAGISVPLNFTGGRTAKYLNVGASYNLEQLYYNGIGKNVFHNRTLHYTNAFLSFINQSRQARQHINPRWAQTFTGTYRYAIKLSDSRKFVGNGLLYFPGLFINHSLVLQGAFQKRDTMADLFSNTFSYSRGYQALSTRQMYKLAANYHFPLIYPDWGFANMIYFQRIRANAFYDHTVAKARLNTILTNILNRSAGAEIFFDTKIWNALPVSFGFRYSRLLDTDLINRSVTNRWEFILPLNFIPD